MLRRDLLKTLAVLPALSFSGKLLSAPATDNKFLLVFLRGGYDAANLLVPFSSSFYYESRPTIAIPKPGTHPHAAIALTNDWGLHPALRDNVYPLFQRRQMAFIPFAGTDDLSRSHFETQDTIELGQPINSPRNFQSGFMNRLAAQLNTKNQKNIPTAISFTDQIPLSMRGVIDIPNVSLNKFKASTLNSQQSQIIDSMYKDTQFSHQVEQGFTMREQMQAQLRDEPDNAARKAISTKGFELEAKRIATLMREQYNLGFVDVGGWDTHVAQGAGTGTLANHLEELGRGLAGFADSMGSAWNKTMVIVISEFGRTFHENGNRGTDHGHGSVYWILGGNIAGGKIVGEQVTVNEKNLFQHRDFQVLNDYRSVIGGLVGRHLELSNNQMAQVFSGVSFTDVGLV